MPETIQFVQAPFKFLSPSNTYRTDVFFFVIQKSTSPLLLGLPWLRWHVLVINWTSSEVLHWGKLCFFPCFPSSCRKNYSITIKLSNSGRVVPSAEGCPLSSVYIDNKNLLYLQSAHLLKRRIISWGHSAKLADHSGVRESLELISCHYRWPNLDPHQSPIWALPVPNYL